MRSARPPGPPSTVSGSSGQGLIYGTHRPRVPHLAFTPESSNAGKAKKKTKIIVVLGIALPVLACIIGIAAWAVTTDVLRINPRANDNGYNRFGHQGKTRIDNMQSRSDTDVDVFVLHGITPPTSSSSSVVANSTKKVSSSTSSSTPKTTLSTRHTPTSPTAADVLSKLISDMPPPKHPKNFIVFAPVADTENEANSRQGRRFDSKVVVREEDLVAEESIVAEDISQELEAGERHITRRKNPSNFGAYTLKPGMRPPPQKKDNKKDKLFTNSRFPFSQPFSESPPTLIKRPQRGESVTFPTSSKPPINIKTNRNVGITQPRTNENFQQRKNFLNQRQNNKNGNQNINKMRSGQDYRPFRNQQPPENAQSLNFQKHSYQQSPPQQFHSMPTPTHQTQETISMMEASKTNLYKKDNLRDNQRNVQNSQNTVPPLSHQSHFLSQTKPSTANQPNFPTLPENIHSPENSPQGGPQYFAPPPQSFHTKINYDQQPSKFQSSPPPLSTYEKVAQTSVDTVSDGTHHHHHHHHHHEPVPSNSDPVGDVNYADADRLGTIGIGMAPARGITFQIGGGGGGLGGLLPLGTLGIVRNIASALLPRPQLGLNSKVFLGVEVGRGGGLSVGLG